MSIFDITKGMVTGLADEVLRDLLDRLVTAEARARGIPLHSVIVGGNQTAPDGGIDASIGWNGAPDPHGWLPRRLTYFQAKAQIMRRGDIAREMKPKGATRDLFQDLVESGGAYVIFTTDDVGTVAVADRIAVMREQLAGLSGQEDVFLDFWGADRIARWSNSHPGVALWLRQKLGRSLAGWQPFGNWSEASDPSAPYLLDDAERAWIHGDATSVGTAIERLRATLAAPCGVVRLVGVSGMGKTRLAEALFDANVGKGTALCPARAVYADAGLNLGSSPPVVAETLALGGVDTVLVVDNATVALHKQLVAIALRPGSRLSLLTIDYGVEDVQPGDGLLVHLLPSSSAVLEALIAQRHPDFATVDRERLSRFCEGNARMALAIARNGGGLGQLDDAQLLDRLFQTGRASDLDVRRAAEAASLVGAFYVEDTWQLHKEHPVLAQIVRMSAGQFHRHVSTMIDWGVAQQRGPQRAVKPDPIADRLAATVIGSSDPADLIAHFADCGGRLFSSFARRLGRLHDLAEARTIASMLIEPCGRLGDLAKHKADERKAFCALAPAIPEQVLASIEQALAGPGRDAVLADVTSRRELSQLLAHIAYEQAFFERAMLAIAQIVCREAVEDRPFGNDRPARDTFRQKFQPSWAWTLATQDDRLRLIERLLDHNEAAFRQLGIDALEQMLTTHIRGQSERDFGMRARDTEWRPRDYREWLQSAAVRLERLALSGEPEADAARAAVARRFEEHPDADMRNTLLATMRRIQPKHYWDEGWRAMAHVLHFGLRTASAADRAAVLAFEKALRPGTIDAQFEAFVLSDPWRHWHPTGRAKRPSRNTAHLARAVGRRLASSNADVSCYVDRACCTSGPSNAFHFGVGLGHFAPDIDAVWKQAYQSYQAAPVDQRSLGVLTGILSGAENRPSGRAWSARTLAALGEDPSMREHIAVFRTRRTLDGVDVRSLRQALERGDITPQNLQVLMFGGVTKDVSGADLALLLNAMIDRSDGIAPALQVLYMRFFGDRSDRVPLAPELVVTARRLLTDVRCYKDARNRADHELAALAEDVFAQQADPDLATAICEAMCQARREMHNAYSSVEFDGLARTLMRYHQREVLDTVVKSAQSERDRSLAGLFFGGWLIDDDDVTSSENVVLDLSLLREWISHDLQSRSVTLARLVPYMGNDQANEPRGWTPCARLLLQLTPDPVAVLEVFEERFHVGSGSGSWASRLERRRPLLDELKNAGNRAVRNWARDAMDRLQRSIAKYERLERPGESLFE